MIIVTTNYVCDACGKTQSIVKESGIHDDVHVPRLDGWKNIHQYICKATFSEFNNDWHYELRNNIYLCPECIVKNQEELDKRERRKKEKIEEPKSKVYDLFNGKIKGV